MNIENKCQLRYLLEDKLYCQDSNVVIVNLNNSLIKLNKISTRTTSTFLFSNDTNYLLYDFSFEILNQNFLYKKERVNIKETFAVLYPLLTMELNILIKYIYYENGGKVTVYIFPNGIEIIEKDK